MFSIFRTIWYVLPAHVPQAGDGAVSGREAIPGAAISRPHHSFARSGRRRALRGVLSLRGGLPGGLHCPAGDRRSHRPALSGIFPHQFLALHFLRILRGGVPDVCHPAHSRFRDGRVQSAEPGVRKAGPADQRPRQVPRLQLLAGRRSQDRRKGQGRGGERRPPRWTCAACCRESLC